MTYLSSIVSGFVAVLLVYMVFFMEPKSSAFELKRLVELDQSKTKRLL